MNRLVEVFAASLASICVAFGRAGQPTGDLIVVPKTEEFVLGAVRHHDFRAIGRGLGSRVKEAYAGGRVLVVRPPSGSNWRQYRQTLLATGSYESVEPNTVAELTAMPDDPLFNNQWHLFQISAPRAWDFETGTNSPILAVVDGGVNLTHPDLAPNLVPGFNTISGLAQAQGGAVNDVTTSGHGTRTAGVAAARGNNGIGVSGVGWDLRVMPIRATDNVSGATPRSELLEGVQWAVQNGAKVVSVSYTEVEYQDVEAMGAWARSQGALLVWSAGNSNTNWANFDHDNVTVVGGTDQTDSRWNPSPTSGSGYGKGVDCFAPCTQIYTINKAGGYGNAPAGVSFAVPQVAATLALMMGRSPSLTPSEIEKRMLLRCGNMGPLGNDLNFGFGRLNAGAAVEWPIRKYQLELLPTSAIPGATNVWPYKIIDDGTVYGVVYRNGQSCVIAKWLDGNLVNWQTSEQALGISFTDIVITDVNENGVLTGWAYNGEYYGFILGSGGLIDFLHNPSLNRSYINGISNSGHAVGLHMLGWGNTRARFRDISGSWSAPLESPPYNIGGSTGFYKIAEDHRVVGSIGSQPIFFRSDLGIEYCEPNGFLNVEVMESTEEGAFVGWFAPDAPSADSWYIRAILYSAKGAILRNFGVFTYAPGINESLEVVGADITNTSASVAARIFDGYNPGLLIDKLVPQPIRQIRCCQQR
ncbi:MAG: S8 family serine peptidase [Chthonomonas sp.]|nr:S8 family serine peptidase [Chthonomonas sp.]